MRIDTTWQVIEESPRQYAPQGGHLSNQPDENIFEQPFSSPRTEIRPYHTYKQDGVHFAFPAGTVVDRKA